MIDPPTILGARTRSLEVLATLGERLADTVPDSVETVVAVGSLGRLELLPRSDLDLVIVLAEGTRADPVAADEAFRAVWTVAETLGYDRPKSRGIFAEPTSIAALTDPASRGVVDEEPAAFGKRIQLLLEGRPAFGPAGYDVLIERVVRWYGFGEPQPGPFAEWSFALHDLLRYRHSLAVRYQWLHRDDPAVWQPLVVKWSFSRTLNLAGLIALLGECSVAGSPLVFLRERLPETPLERLGFVDDLGSLYEPFLAAMADDDTRTALARDGSTEFDELRVAGVEFRSRIADALREQSAGWDPRFVAEW